MSEGWVKTCERILEQMRKMSEKRDKDRLDLIQSMRFSLYALHRSILGWLNWVNNPDIMVSFKREELEEMNKALLPNRRGVKQKRELEEHRKMRSTYSGNE